MNRSKKKHRLGRTNRKDILVDLNPKISIMTSQSNKPNTSIKNKGSQNGWK